MNKQKIFLIGGGGHCCSCIDVIEQEGLYEIAGIFDLKENIGKKVLNYEIIDTDENLAKYFHITKNVLITIGQIKNPDVRWKKFQALKTVGAQFVSPVSPRAHVSRHAKIGEGTIVMHDVLVNANAVVGDNCILNTKSLIEHDAVIGSHSHMATASVINGDVRIGELSFVGSNAVIREGIILPERSLVPAGSFFKGERR